MVRVRQRARKAKPNTEKINAEECKTQEEHPPCDQKNLNAEVNEGPEISKNASDSQKFDEKCQSNDAVGSNERGEKPKNEPYFRKVEGESEDESYDYCIEFLNSLDWNRPIKRTTAMSPWIGEDEWKHSLAHKYMNYEMEKDYVDLDNPLFDGPLLEDLRKKESRRKSKKKDSSNAEYSIIKEGVVEVDDQKSNKSSESEDDFLDEFGNIREEAKQPIEEKCSSEDENDPKSSIESKKQRRKRGKGKGKNRHKSNDLVTSPLKDTQLNEEVLQQSSKHFIDYDKAPNENVSGEGLDALKSDDTHIQPIVKNNAEQKASDSHLITTFNFEEPQHSLLNSKEQKAYMALLDKFRSYSQEDISLLKRGGGNEIDNSDWTVYQEYRNLVLDEQADFQKWCKEVFVQHGNSGIGNLQADVRRYIDEYYEQRLRRVYQQIPRLYLPIGQLNDKKHDTSQSLRRLIPMVTEQAIQKPRFEMRFEKTICHLGSVPKIIIPNQWKLRDNVTLPANYQTLIERYPPNDDHSSCAKQPGVNVKGQKMYKINISSDPNAEKLALTYKPDIVISTSALKVIFNNFGPNYDRDWEIPVTSWMIEEGRHVIIIDKPLPRKSLNILDRKKWYSKLGTKSFLLQREGKFRGNPDACSSEIEAEGPRDRSCKNYRDLTLFQVDGMNDHSSSSEDDNMVIDEGPLPEDKVCTSKKNATTSKKSDCNPQLQESEEADSDESCIINPKLKQLQLNSQLMASLGLTAEGYEKAQPTR